MIQPLRKRHKLIWSIFAVLLPLGFIMALLSIPPHTGPGESNEPIKVHLLGDGEQKVLEVVVEGPIKSGFANVYSAADETTDIDEATLLGPLHGTGTYRYQLWPDMTPSTLIIFDQFKNEIIQTISVKTP